MKRINKGFIFIAIAGIFWSTIGLFSNTLMVNGLQPQQVAFIRLSLGSVFLLAYSLFTNHSLLRITKKGIIFSIILGFICHALFNLAYLSSIRSVGVSIAAVLLYTSPLFLALFSKIFFKETLNKNKILSLALCFIGALFAATGGKLTLDGLNPVGVLLGILAAIAFALMSIISKHALVENESITIIMYSFFFGALIMLPICKPGEIVSLASNFSMLFNMIGLGLFPATLAYIWYFKGISEGVELSVAGIISSSELIFAQFIGWILLGEDFAIMKLLGLVLMLMSALVVMRSKKEEIISDDVSLA